MAPPLFKVSEKVLVPHIDQHYEAKVMKAEVQADGIWYYFLHYHGWNKKWDEWVEETGLRKCPEASVPTTVAPAKRSVAKASGNAAGEGTPKSRKRRVGEISNANLAINVDILPILKKQLLDEHDAINVHNKFLALPRQPTAMEVLNQFVLHGGNSRCTSTELRHLATGLEEYLDKVLESRLLYRPEWEDAEKILADGTCASAIYGAEHLLRLLLKLPEIIPTMPSTQQQVTSLRARLQDFANFLMSNRHIFFAKIAEYRPRAQSSLASDGSPSGRVHHPAATP